jgi:hypothetical protein
VVRITRRAIGHLDRPPVEHACCRHWCGAYHVRKNVGASGTRTLDSFSTA